MTKATGVYRRKRNAHLFCSIGITFKIVFRTIPRGRDTHGIPSRWQVDTVQTEGWLVYNWKGIISSVQSYCLPDNVPCERLNNHLLRNNIRRQWESKKMCDEYSYNSGIGGYFTFNINKEKVSEEVITTWSVLITLRSMLNINTRYTSICSTQAIAFYCSYRV